MRTIGKVSKKYLQLIERFPLKPIRDEKSMDLASKLFSELGMKGDRLSQDEADYLTVLGKLMYEYEMQNPTFLDEPLLPEEVLASLLEDNGMTQTELARRLEIPQPVLSAFLSGKRGLSKDNMMLIADYFAVSPALFLSKKSKGRKTA